MTPPKEHTHVDVLVSAGAGPDITVGEPGTHGLAVTGVHGIGVKTPNAAAVAAATAGLARLMHIPNGVMLTNGLLSMMLATGCPLDVIRDVGRTTSVAGAAPIAHCVIAELTTN